MIDASLKAENRCNDSMSNLDSGKISLEKTVIKYESSIYRSWHIRLSDIKVIGEYTNQNGPFADDYFLAFVTNPDGGWYEASFYAEGRELLLQELYSKFIVDPQHSLVASTDFNSVILWPKELSGRPMFEFRTDGLLGRLGLRNKQYLASEVLSFLKT